MNAINDSGTLRETISRLVAETPVLDIHTHLYSEEFGDLVLRGPEELIRYHYLQAETNRVLDDLTPAEFIALNKSAQARLIWQHLFVERSPISEAARGIVTTWNRLEAPDVRNYEGVLAYFSEMSVTEHIDRVFEIANVSRVVMTNDPFDPIEQEVWDSGVPIDTRFHAALRLDSILVNWPATWPKMRAMGYNVTLELSDLTLAEIARFLKDWAKKMHPLYV